MKFFDTHAHYNDEKFDADREEQIQKLAENDIAYVTVVGCNEKTSKQAVTLAKTHENLYATVGISPNDLEGKISLESIEELAKESKVVAIGEIGLDYYWNKENKELQQEIFMKQIDLANQLDLPICIHTREAVQDTLEILKHRMPAKHKGIIHCCPLNVELIKEVLKLGFMISFSGNVTFKNAKNADKCILQVPFDRILIETDSPYLTPEPNRGKRNNPIYVKYVAHKIAQVKQMKLEDIAKITLENAKRVYRIS